jgi:glycosyltransferase involved in cell wall biosynthesis
MASGAGAMKVLYLTTNPNLGASSRVLADWLLLSNQRDMISSVVYQKEGDLGHWLRENHIPHLLDPMPWPERLQPWHMLYHAWRVARFARRQGAEIIQCYEQDLYPFALVLRRLLRRPLICHMHFVLTPAYARWLFGRSSRKPDAVIWTSHQHQKDCAAAVDGLVPTQRQHVIYSGLSLTRFGNLVDHRDALRKQWGVNKDQIVVGVACALRAGKRVGDFLELIRRVTRRYPHVVGVLAGGAVPGAEAYAADILPHMKALEAEGRFHYLGYLEPIEPFVHAVDIMVSTSEFETFGNTAVEAMACRRPMAAYQGGSIQEILGDVGLVVENCNLEALTAAVARLIENPSLRQERGERGRQRVAEQFNPALTLEQLKELYTSLLLPGSRTKEVTAHVS